MVVLWLSHSQCLDETLLSSLTAVTLCHNMHGPQALCSTKDCKINHMSMECMLSMRMNTHECTYRCRLFESSQLIESQLVLASEQQMTLTNPETFCCPRSVCVCVFLSVCVTPASGHNVLHPISYKSFCLCALKTRHNICPAWTQRIMSWKALPSGHLSLLSSSSILLS